jgi:ubiquitin-like 1-activating enzyme E1 B
LQEWTLAQTAKAFVTAVYAFHKHREADIGSSHFTKDDALAVVVVSAASNLRSLCYGIPVQSQFAAMGMAGNIIHAIATTNAAVGGLITLEAMKVLTDCKEACTYTYLTGV